MTTGTGKESIEVEDGHIAAPENVVPSAAAAKTIYERMRESHFKRARTFARIQGMIDGNPPYAPSLMKKHGMTTTSNVNWRDAEAIVDSVCLTYWSLFNDVQYIADFNTSLADDSSNAIIGETVSRHWDRIVREWPRFQEIMSENQKDLISFGSSFVTWPDEEDWRFESTDVWRFLVSEKTRNSTELIGLCAVEMVMTAQELWAIYEGLEEDDESSEWNKEAVGDILLHHSNYKKIEGDKRYSGQILAELQTRIRNGDANIDDLYNDDIPLVSMLIRELDDSRISRGIFSPEIVVVGGSGDWAYFSDRQYEEMSHAIQTFSFTPGEKYIHGNKGIGHRIFNTIEGITQIDNSLMDSIRRSSTVLVRSRTGRNKDFKQIQFNHGGFTDIGEAEYIQNLMGSNNGSNIEGVRYFRGKLDFNNNISGATMNNPDGKPRSLGEVQIQATKEAKVQKNRISHYYDQLDCLFREMVRKMLLAKESSAGYEFVKLWKERCIADGVPEEFFILTDSNAGQNGLPEHMTVRATRASGSGSQVADQIETRSMMTLLPTLGERGRQNVLSDFVAAHRGHQYIDRYLPDEDRQQQPVGDDTIASIENNQLEKGELVIVSPDNNHAIHGPRHIERMDQIATIFNEAEDAARNAGSKTPSVDAGQFGQYSLEEVDVAFQTLGPHFVRHLLFLQQDPTRAALAQSLARKWAILANFGDKIAHNAQEHRVAKMRELQEQQEELDALDGEERIEQRKLEIELSLKEQKLRGEMQLAANRDQLKFVLERQKVSFENQIKKAKAISDIAIQESKNKETPREQLDGKGSNELF